MQENKVNIDSLPYSKEEKWALKMFEKERAETGLSQNKLSMKIGLTQSTISKLKSGTYKNPEEQFEILISYFKVKEATKNGFKGVPFAETSISKTIYEKIRECQEDGDLCVISGDAGIGKTKTIHKYAKDNSTNTILLTCSGFGNEIKGLMDDMATQLGIQPKTISKMRIEILNKLKDGMVIIVDEAQFLNLPAIEILRSMSDKFSDRGMTLGIVFSGNNLTISNMKNGSEILQQIESRIGNTTILHTTDVTKEDIKLVFPFLDEEGKEMELELIHKISTNKIQGIRGANGLYKKAFRKAKKQNTELDYDFLIKVAKDINLKV